MDENHVVAALDRCACCWRDAHTVGAVDGPLDMMIDDR